MATRRPTPPEAPPLYVAEPPAAYGMRPPLVVDASVLAAALFGEERHALAVTLLTIRALAAPHLLDCEIANVGLKKLRREGVPEDTVVRALHLYAKLDIARHPVDAAAVLSLAQRYTLSAYDAAYLWLAETLVAPLATFDDKLATAARRHLPGGASPPHSGPEAR